MKSIINKDKLVVAIKRNIFINLPDIVTQINGLPSFIVLPALNRLKRKDDIK